MIYNGAPTPPGTVQVYAHRGARAYYPENTLEAYEQALALGVDYIDADIVMSKEGELVVCHDPQLNPDITRDQHGVFIEKAILVRELTVQELKTYNVGLIKPVTAYARLFPEQVALDAAIPTLEELIDLIKSRAKHPIGLQIEIKRGAPIDAMSATLVALLEQKEMIHQCEVQSFDWECLHAIHQLNPMIKTAFLTKETQEIDFEKIKQLGGSIWGPYEMDVTEAHIEQAHALGLKVVAWGWPEKEGSSFHAAHLRKLIAWNIDGIITDAPRQLHHLLSERAQLP